MSTIQDLAKRWLPKSWADSMEQESRHWIIECPECGNFKSVWDAGGIRWKAKSYGKRIRTRCSQCGQTVWATVDYYAKLPEDETTTV